MEVDTERKSATWGSRVDGSLRPTFALSRTVPSRYASFTSTVATESGGSSAITEPPCAETFSACGPTRVWVAKVLAAFRTASCRMRAVIHAALEAVALEGVRPPSPDDGRHSLNSES